MVGGPGRLWKLFFKQNKKNPANTAHNAVVMTLNEAFVCDDHFKSNKQ